MAGRRVAQASRRTMQINIARNAVVAGNGAWEAGMAACAFGLRMRSETAPGLLFPDSLRLPWVAQKRLLKFARYMGVEEFGSVVFDFCKKIFCDMGKFL